jgi:hypothetical protein
MISMIDPIVTPAEALVYLDASGATDWPDTEYLQTTAIMRGQRYIAAKYNGRWLNGIDPVPAPIKYAVIEAALVEAKTPGFFTKTYTSSDAKVLVAVEGIRWERVGGSDMAPASTIVDGLLAPYIGSTTGRTKWLSRA